ncbi:hypothetical protein DOS84_00235 [Flavobacterium aquariorum]|uniref:Uncharacterized protein n=1 Tax=Flavobacterium aquariorum TaxID=2217670 RepID=A0A2W7VSA6_9FLAO|nr:hypothetical protein [Flavobacterium aquariorum]PZX95032.1 hypothetical protein DOS84_00235 [Flavobacterium aquariorum]
MKKKIVLILFLVVGAIGYSQALDCSKLKNIKAYNPDYPKKTFVIKGNTQESYDNGVLQMSWSVKWVTDCQYEVTCTKKSVESQIEVGDRIVVDVMSIDGDCFTIKRTFHCKNIPDGDVDPESTFCIAK